MYKLSNTYTFFSRFEGTRGEKQTNILHHRRLKPYNLSIKEETWKNKTEYFTNFSLCYCDGVQDGFVDA